MSTTRTTPNTAGTLTAVAARDPRRMIGRLAACAAAVTVVAAPLVTASTAHAESVVSLDAYSAFAAEGPNNSLNVWEGPAGGPFVKQVVAGAGHAYSAPSLAIQSNDLMVVTVEGPNNSLNTYAQYLGEDGWEFIKAAGADTTYSAPTVTAIVPPQGGTSSFTLAAEGPDHSLIVRNLPDGAAKWSMQYVSGDGITYSTPSITQVDGSTVVSALGVSDALDFDWQTIGTSAWHFETVAGAGSAFSAPSVSLVVPGGGAADEASIAVQGPSSSLDVWTQTVGQAQWTQTVVSGAGTTDSAPALMQAGGSMVISWVGPSNLIEFAWHPIGGSGWNPQVVGTFKWGFGNPTMTVLAPGGGANDSAEIAEQGPSNSLYAYVEPFGSGTWTTLQVAIAGNAFA